MFGQWSLSLADVGLRCMYSKISQRMMARPRNDDLTMTKLAPAGWHTPGRLAHLQSKSGPAARLCEPLRPRYPSRFQVRLLQLQQPAYHT